MRIARPSVAALARLAALGAAALLAPSSAGAATLALSASTPTTAIPSGSVAAESPNRPALALTLTASGGTVTVSTIRASIGAGVGAVTIRAAQLWVDADNSGTVTSGDTFLAAGGWSPALGKYVFGGLNLAVSATSRLLVVVGVGAPYVNGSTYGAASSSSYAVSVTSTDVLVDQGNSVTAGTVTGPTSTVAANAVVEGSPTANTNVPVLSILNPTEGGTVSPTCATCSPANSFRVQIQIFSPTAGGAITNPQLSTDNGATWLATPVPAVNSNYTAGLPANTYIYQATLTACASGCNLTPGIYSLRARASNTAGTNINSQGVVIAVNPPGEGDGNLLARDNSSQLCADCHAIQSHSSATTSAKYGSWSTTCRDCHTPHQTANVKLVRNTIGPPAANGFQSTRKVNFGALTGDSNLNISSSNFGSSSFTNADNSGPCQVCHTRTAPSGSPTTARWRNTGNSDTHYTAAAGTQACTGCHDHAKGFAGGGESSGNTACTGCHNALFTAMNSTTGGHHHYLNNADVTTLASGSKYPNAAPGGTTDANRRCLMCHVDHDFFRPDLDASGGRGKNLRTDIATLPTATANFTNRDFDSSLTTGGICVSCHTNELTRSFTDSTAGTKTMAITKANFQGSAHTFSGAGTTATFKDTLTNTMVGDCGKCHDDTTTKSYQTGYPQAIHDSSIRSMMAPVGIASPTDPLAEKLCYQCHRLTTDVVSGWTNKGTANRDYFNLVPMTTQSERIYQVVTNSTTYPFGHPVGSNSGPHKPSDGEGAAANDGSLSGVTNRHVTCADCHNPHAAKPIDATRRGSITTWAAGTVPNADTLTDSTKTWTANQWKGCTVKILSGTGAGATSAIYGNTTNALSVEFGTGVPAAGSTYVILGSGLSTGNLSEGAENAAWGLNPTWPARPAATSWDDSNGAPTNAADDTTRYNAIATWGRTTTPTIQAQICIKCHSAYAYGSSPPSTLSGLPNSTSTTWGNTTGGTMPQSDLANQFNPNNMSHHAVFARGQNQPLVSSASVTSTYNPNWPRFTSGTGITVSTAACATPPCTVTLAGSTWPTTVVPGWFIYIGSAAPAQATAGWFEVVSVDTTTTLKVNRATSLLSAQTFFLTAGLGNNFVPPWGPWSTLQCTDCHTSDVTTDPFGPHGSGTKWSLRKFTTQTFMFYNGTASTPTNVVAVSLAPGDANNFCLNCHRTDVYGDYNVTAPANYAYARQNHPIDGGKNHSLTVKNKWGIVCMNCHGGARAGTIHGTNFGQGAAGAAGSNSGKRFLAGSTWYGSTRATTTVAGACWTKGSADSVDNCAHTHTNQTWAFGGATYTGLANYNYDTNP